MLIELELISFSMEFFFLCFALEDYGSGNRSFLLELRVVRDLVDPTNVYPTRKI